MHIGKKHYEQRLAKLISNLQGHCLLLTPKENLRTQLPSSVISIQEWPKVSAEKPFDAILSIGNLAISENINDYLVELQGYAGRETLLYFCDRTTTPTGNNGSAKNDITGALWEAKWSVIYCERFTIGKTRRAPKYVYGTARMKRSPEENL